MNFSETAQMLAAMSAFDRRTIGEADVVAWQSVLADVEYDDATQAVRDWYGANTEWMMPAHVRRLAAEIVKKRTVSPWAPGQHGIPREEALPEVTSGERLTSDDISPEVVDLLGRLRSALPDVDRGRLFPRQAAWDRAQRDYRRAQGGEPNPHYRPRGVDDRLRDVCRVESAHDSGVHADGCPDAIKYDMAGAHQHRASCHGAIGELLCGNTD